MKGQARLSFYTTDANDIWRSYIGRFRLSDGQLREVYYSTGETFQPQNTITGPHSNGFDRVNRVLRFTSGSGSQVTQQFSSNLFRVENGILFDHGRTSVNGDENSGAGGGYAAFSDINTNQFKTVVRDLLANGTTVPNTFHIFNDDGTVVEDTSYGLGINPYDIFDVAQDGRGHYYIGTGNYSNKTVTIKKATDWTDPNSVVDLITIPFGDRDTNGNTDEPGALGWTGGRLVYISYYGATVQTYTRQGALDESIPFHLNNNAARSRLPNGETLIGFIDMG